MANKTHLTTSFAIREHEFKLLFSAMVGVVKGFTLAFGVVASVSLLLAFCVALLKVSEKSHIVYSIPALADSGFQHFLPVIGGALTLVMIVATGFMWALVKSLNNDQDLDAFLAYLHYRRRKREIRKRVNNSKAGNGNGASFASGVASILDFGNTLAPSAPGLTPRQRDYLALKSDWTAVGNDLQAAVNRFDKELTQDERGATVGGGGRFA